MINIYIQEKDGSSTESITYIGTVDNCINQVYWFTSLACLPAQRQAVETGSCVLEIPGPDIKVDLLAWSADTYYRANSELAGQQRSFQLNLCRPASTSLCGNESLVCEVDDNWEAAKQNIIEKDPVKLASYDALREVIVLKYDSGTARVSIEIECDAGEENPRISLVHNNGSDYTFSMKTAKACFVPVRCSQLKYFNLNPTNHSGRSLSCREPVWENIQLREPSRHGVGLHPEDVRQQDIQVPNQGLRLSANLREPAQRHHSLPL